MTQKELVVAIKIKRLKFETAKILIRLNFTHTSALKYFLSWMAR